MPPAAASHRDDLRLTSARLVVVSGKGGVGKTTVAAAIAVAAARGGKRVLLAEAEDRQAFAPLFGLERIGYEERTIAPNVWGLSIEADEALVEYLRLFYGIPRFSRALIQSKAVEFATHTAPGLRDILLIGKAKEAERRVRGVGFVYDTIVLDAPPTGRLPRFLDAPRAIVELVGSGPIRGQAQGVLDMVTDPARMHVVLVVQPENMPVRETIETLETLSKGGIATGPLVINGLWPEIPGLGRQPALTLGAQAEKESLSLSDVALEQLGIVAAAQARRARNQRRAIKQLTDEVGLPHLHLPYLFTSRIAEPQITRLASIVKESGLL